MSRLGSPQAGSRRVAIAKPKNDIYVVLLAISAGALAIGTLLLILEWNSYRTDQNPKSAAVQPASPVYSQLA